jgi:hypothetical protein
MPAPPSPVDSSIQLVARQIWAFNDFDLLHLNVFSRGEVSMATPNVERIVQSIAAATSTSPETVSRLYLATFRDMAVDARVMDYLPLFAARRVLEHLKSHEASEVS